MWVMVGKKIVGGCRSSAPAAEHRSRPGSQRDNSSLQGESASVCGAGGRV